MNKDRRDELRNIASSVDDALDGFQTLIDDLELVISDEEDAYDNLPLSVQESSKGDIMQGYISDMEDIISELENLRDETQDKLEKIKEKILGIANR